MKRRRFTPPVPPARSNALEAMVMQQIKYLIGTPVLSPFPFFSPFDFLDEALATGTAVLSSTQIVVTSAIAKVVFTGTFTIAGNDVTGGTMTGFAVYVGSTKLIQAKGYSLDAAALYDTIQTYSVDYQPFDNLIFGGATKFVGSRYGDLISDTEFADTLLGKDGADVLFGFGGNDTLKGGDGSDFLADGEGINKFFGDEGNDVFGFQLSSLNTENPVSKIKDFEKGEDLITLLTDIAALKPGGLAPQYFHKGGGAADGDDYVIYDKPSGKVFIDFDGSGAGAQIQFAKVTAGTKLQADDFMVGFSTM